jgi:hypothetical protein
MGKLRSDFSLICANKILTKVIIRTLDTLGSGTISSSILTGYGNRLMLFGAR